jgi:hypothetical protein
MALELINMVHIWHFMFFYLFHPILFQQNIKIHKNKIYFLYFLIPIST